MHAASKPRVPIRFEADCPRVRKARPMSKLPKWVDIALIPLINLFLALVVSGLVVLYIGENPLQAISIMVNGAVGSSYATPTASPT